MQLVSHFAAYSNFAVIVCVLTLFSPLFRQAHITSQTECKIPFGIGIASDPMALRRGGKKLAMEDICYYQWPLPGVDQVLSIISFSDIYLHTSNDLLFLIFHVAVWNVRHM